MAQKLVTPLATSLLHFQLNKLFKNMACILALFGLATVLATFQKILGNFFQIIGSPCTRRLLLSKANQPNLKLKIQSNNFQMNSHQILHSPLRLTI
jgi:hypothetical protein